MKIEELNINKIRMYEHNAKEHPEEQIQQIIKSVEEFGFNDPIAIDENNVIIEGHGRMMALERLGWKKVPVIRLSHLDENKKKAYIIAHKKLTMNTGFDIEKLTEELEFLKTQDYDLTQTGYTWEELDGILNTDNPEEIEEDNFIPELPVEPKTKLGDIWHLGPHKIICGSSTEEETVKNLLQEEQIDLIVTDPPYNVNYVSRTTGMSIDNDHYEDENAFGDFIEDFYRLTAEHTKPGSPIYIFHADTKWQFKSRLEQTDFELKQLLIWVKNAFVFGRSDYHWRHEPILYGWKKGGPHKWYGNRDKSTVIDDAKPDYKNMKKEELIELLKQYTENKATDTVIYNDKPTFNDIHPTMKPVKLLAKLIANSSKTKDIVYDGFAGSGSTMIACDKLGRISRNVELDPAYVDSVVERYKKQAGTEDIWLYRDGETYSYDEIMEREE